MRPPGTRLRAFALHVCDSRTIDRIVDPILTDIRHEVAAASASPLARRWWIIARAYASFWKALCVHGGLTAIGTTAQERCAIAAIGRRLLWPTIAMTAIGMAVMIAVPAASIGSSLWRADARVFLYLIPQALPIAVPLGILWGALWGAGRTPAGRGTRRIIVAAGIIGTLTTFSTVTWLLPDANHAFRETVYSSFGRPPARGPNELGWNELRREMALSPGSVHLRLAWNVRVAVTCTPLVLGATLPLLLAGGRRRALAQAVTAVVAYASGFVLMDWDAANRAAAALTPILVVWMPTVTALAGSAMFVIGRRRLRPGGISPFA